jgi:type II secretory pathway component PulF
MAVALKHKAQLYRQLFVGFKSGLPIERLLETEILPKVFAPQSRRLARNVQEGKPLSLALRSANVVQRWEEQLLAIGEDSGRLDSVLADLAQFFETRHRNLSALKARLVYPGLILLAAILVRPLPDIARGTLDVGTYLLEAGLKVLILYLLYKVLIVRPFENATATAFNPLIFRGLRYVSDQHWLRMMYEVAYLNLLTLCLESGLDAAQTLKLMREGSADPGYRWEHGQALKQVEQSGLSLAQALAANGIIRNTQVFSFLNASEKSGTLHSDMRVFLMKKQEEAAKNLRHFVKTLALWLYLISIGIVVAGYV